MEIKERHNIRQIEFVSNISNLTRINTVFSVPLKELKFENIKSFESVEIYPNKLNLFAGKNSSGKSTILETIALLTNCRTQKTMFTAALLLNMILALKTLMSLNQISQILTKM